MENNIFKSEWETGFGELPKKYRQHPLPPDKNKLKIVNSFLTRLWCTEYLEKKEIVILKKEYEIFKKENFSFRSESHDAKPPKHAGHDGMG